VLRVGVVGLNERVRKQVLPAVAASPRARIAALCSRDAAKASAFASEYPGCRSFDDYGAFVDCDEVDAVFVMTPPQQHAEMSLAALGRGRAVMCEKPLATTLAEAEAMVAAAERARLRTAVNFTYRSVTALRAVEQALVDPGIGELLHAEVAYYQGRGLLRPRRPEHVLRELGAHAVDALLWWCDRLGAGAPRAAAGMATADDPALAFGALVELERGAFATVHASKGALGYTNAIVARLHGRAGALALHFDVEGFALTHHSAADPSIATTIEPPPELRLSFAEFPRYHWDRVVGALLGQERFPDFHQGLRVQAVLEAAIASEASQRREPIRRR
jgi:predicted dehydrogenase